MNACSPPLGVRHAAIALAIASIALLGCARKLQIEIPAGFHGHVQITCAGLTMDRTGTLHVDHDGVITAVTCPARQAETVVTRAGEQAPVDTSIMWTTTGDGLVRAISFDVR